TVDVESPASLEPVTRREATYQELGKPAKTMRHGHQRMQLDKERVGDQQRNWDREPDAYRRPKRTGKAWKDKCACDIDECRACEHNEQHGPSDGFRVAASRDGTTPDLGVLFVSLVKKKAHKEPVGERADHSSNDNCKHVVS